MIIANGTQASYSIKPSMEGHTLCFPDALALNPILVFSNNLFSKVNRVEADDHKTALRRLG